MKTWWMGLAACALMLVPGLATAKSGTQGPARWLTMVVTGHIVVNPDGTVASYVLDDPANVPVGATREMAKAVPAWKFEPVVRDGKPVTFKSYMSVRLVGKPMANGNFAIHVSGARFATVQQKPSAHRQGESASRYTRKPPKYSGRLRRYRVSGTVYLMLQIDRTGQVRRVAAQQVDLFKTGEMSPEDARHALAHASIEAAKAWAFSAPPPDELASDGYWYALAPVTFQIEPGVSRYGPWRAYVPGPKQHIPWLDPELVAVGSADAMPADGGVYPARQSLHLLSSLGGS